MLRGIVAFSLRFRGMVVALAAVLIVYGGYVATRATFDVFPDFVPPQATIQTEAPGLSPEQVETLVTRPLESALNGVGHQESLRSESAQGLSVITIIFQEGTAILPARQLLAEKLGEVAGSLPAGVKAPKISPLTSATMDLLKIGLTSDTRSPRELRAFADWILKPRLLAVPGVAKCSTFGGEVGQWQIQVHPDQLVAHHVTLTEVLTAGRSATGVRGAGFIDTPTQRIVLQTEGQSATAASLGGILVAVSEGGAPVRLGDVATIVETGAPKFGDALVQGRPGVLMTMSSQYGANTLEVTKALDAALKNLKPIFDRERITLYPELHRPATFVETALANMRHSLLFGAVLVALVLLLFLGNLRMALISLTAIPLSLLAAIVVLDRCGVSLNTLTLGGLAIAIGEVVDDAIIDVENILRRLRENSRRPVPQPIAGVVLAASIEVRSAVVYASFIVALVFLPVLTLPGLQGSFFAPLAQSYLLAILASLGVALTVTPALALILFSRGGHRAGATRLHRFLRDRYVRGLRRVMCHVTGVTSVVALFCVLAIARLPFLGGGFLPEFREGHFVLAVSMVPGTSLTEMLRIGGALSRELLKIENIATIEQQIGRAEQGEDPWGPQKSEFHVELKPHLSGRDQAKVESEIRDVLKKTPGVRYEVMTFLSDRIGESISGETAPVVVNVFGEDLDQLDATAKEIAQVLNTLSGAADVQVKSPSGAPRMAIRLRPERLTELGLRPMDVLEAVRVAYQGEVVAQVFQANRTTDVAVTLDPVNRRSPEEIGEFLLSTLDGRRVPLREVADVFLTSGRFSILHDGARRRQTVTCNPAGRDVRSFVNDARRAIAERVHFPEGLDVEFAGAVETQRAATRQLLLYSGIAGVGIVLLLSVVLGHWRNLILVLVNLPLALAGGVLALSAAAWWGDPEAGTLTMGAMVGFVTLFGVTTRNAIMLVSHFEHLVQQEGRSWDLATAIRGASERLVPVLMTAAVTGIGLLPLAMGRGEAGQEIEGPMAIVILGGLFTSTTLNLIVLPALALRWGNMSAQKEDPPLRAFS